MSEFKPRQRHRLGAQAETMAEQFLCHQGLKLVGRNYHCRFGEIDLIMRDQCHLVFVEVRYRRSGNYGGALHSIGKHKQSRLIRTARHYLAYEARHAGAICRFDVVAVSAAHFNIQWIQNAFTLSD